MEYKTLEEIRLRRMRLQDEIDKDKSEIGNLWNSLFKPAPPSNRGEYITSLINNSIAIYDGFMLVRKLTAFFRRGRKKSK